MIYTILFNLELLEISKTGKIATQCHPVDYYGGSWENFKFAFHTNGLPFLLPTCLLFHIPV